MSCSFVSGALTVEDRKTAEDGRKDKGRGEGEKGRREKKT
jgi:hypothetical protein